MTAYAERFFRVPRGRERGGGGARPRQASFIQVTGQTPVAALDDALAGDARYTALAPATRIAFLDEVMAPPHTHTRTHALAQAPAPGAS